MSRPTDYTNSTTLERPTKRCRIEWETETLSSIEQAPNYLHNPPQPSYVDDYFDWIDDVLKARHRELIKPVLREDLYCSRVWRAFVDGEYDNDPSLVCYLARKWRKAGLSNDRNRDFWPECFGHGFASLPSQRFYEADVDNPNVRRLASSPPAPPRSPSPSLSSRSVSPPPPNVEQLEDSGDDDDFWSVDDVSPEEIQEEVRRRRNFTSVTIGDFYFDFDE